MSMLMMLMKARMVLTLVAAPPPTQTNLCNLPPPGSRSPSSLLCPDHRGHDYGDGDDGGDDGLFSHIYILGDAKPDVNFIVPGKVIKVPANEQIVFLDALASLRPVLEID